MPAKLVTAAVPVPLPEKLPELPAPSAQFLRYAKENPDVPVRKLLEPFLEYEAALRAYFAQDPTSELVKGDVNLVSLFDDANDKLLEIRGRKLEEEDDGEKQRYVMALEDKDRKSDGEPGLVDSMDEFKRNFNIFTEGSLVNFDWSNIVAAGSAVLTPLLHVPKKERESKKALRAYYHDKLAPASDIDLFIYGIDDPKEAIERIASIEKSIKDNLIWETTTVRTKNTLTIVSQYPNRHVQIVLRLYKSISQILTGFDVNCELVPEAHNFGLPCFCPWHLENISDSKWEGACVAFDGNRVLANPRAIAASMTQCNDMDLTRRSPSYENRLSKYSRRGYEVYCPLLDRSRIDPTIFERAFNRTVGLARLLVLEALPNNEQREKYVLQRKQEMGRPVDNNLRFRYHRFKPRANKKDGAEDDIAEWNFEDVSGYQKFSIPYGPSYDARKIERLFLKKDLLLNAEWNANNKPPHRTVNLHRHPVFLGSVESVVTDCCGFCPEPLTEEEKRVQEGEDAIFVRGSVKFLKDDPGRQEIGSFFPLNPENYTEMAYIRPIESLCKAIVGNDVEFIKSLCATEEGKTRINCRDFCGRTPLQLAVINDNTSIEIVQTLIDSGARLIARMQDGRTALHIAAAKGKVDVVTALLTKSGKNEYERDEREEREKAAARKSQPGDGNSDKSGSIHPTSALSGGDSEYTFGEEDSEDGVDAKTATDGSFVKVKKGEEAEDGVLDDLEGCNDDDIYNINAVDWDYSMSPLHHAIVGGHTKVVQLLVSEFGADPLLPMKLFQKDWRGVRSPKAAILILTLVFQLPEEAQSTMASTLLRLGAKTAQADSFSENTALEHAIFNEGLNVIEKMFEIDGPGAKSVLNKFTGKQNFYYYYGNEAFTPLTMSLTKSLEIAKLLLDQGANGKVTLEDYIRAVGRNRPHCYDGRDDRPDFEKRVFQPLEVSVIFESTCSLVSRLLEAGADPSTISIKTSKNVHWDKNLNEPGETVLDLLRKKIHTYRKYLNEGGEKVVVRENLKLIPVSVLDEYPEGSYDHFCAERHFRNENEIRELANTPSPSPPRVGNTGIGIEKKRKEVEKLLAIFEGAERILVEAGAKTYEELNPGQSPPAGVGKKPQDNSQQEKQEDKFTVPFTVSVSCDESTRERYRILFNAVWGGDLEAVKALTSGNPRLLIAVSHGGWSTFWIAIYRRNFEMARLIMEIAEFQYGKSEGRDFKSPAMTRKSSGDDRDSDDDSDSDDDDEDSDYADEFVIKDPTFTIEDAGAGLGVVKSYVSHDSFFRTFSPPLKELLCKEEYEKLVEQRGTESQQAHWTVLSYAIYKDDEELFDFTLSIAKEVISEDDPIRTYIGPDSDLSLYRGGSHIRLAISLGRISMLEKLMKTVSFGIIFQMLKQADSETKNVKPKWYQGLMVNGKRRLGAGGESRPTGEPKIQKPLQIAAFYCNLDSIKWFLTNRPWECFNEFMNRDPSDPHVKLLRKQGAKLEEAFKDGLGLDSTLLPHICLLGWYGPNPMRAFRYLVSRPGALEAKSCLGLTPALYAAHHLRKDALTYLLREEVGADLSARDFLGRNAMHLILRDCKDARRHEPDTIEDMIKCIPKDILADMFLQRTRSSGLTPLAWYCTTSQADGNHNDHRVCIPVVKLILEYSKGLELRIFNSEGNTPLHTCVRRGHVETARAVLAYDPDLINIENASGRTAFEVAHSRFLMTISNNPPVVNARLHYTAIVERSPEKFLTPKDTVEREPMKWDGVDVKGAYVLAREAVAASKCGRVLVSLTEASGLAERLQKRKDGPTVDHPELPIKTDCLELFQYHTRFGY